MEWMASLRKSIDYMEEHLLADIGAKEVADAVHISPFYFQKGFIVYQYPYCQHKRSGHYSRTEHRICIHAVSCKAAYKYARHAPHNAG